MIRVLIKYDKKNKFESLVLKGHANSAERGHDLVCAAVSAVVFGGINAIQNDDALKISEENEERGMLVLTKVGMMNNHDEIVIETIIKSLESIARDNPKNINISFE